MQVSHLTTTFVELSEFFRRPVSRRCTLISFNWGVDLIFKPFDVRSLSFIFIPRAKTFRSFVTILRQFLRLIRVYGLVITGRTRQIALPRNMNQVIVREKGSKDSRSFQTPSRVEICTSFWGLTHHSLFRDLCLPSILQSGIFSSNFKIPINFVIHCPAEDWLKLESVIHEAISQAGAKYEWVPLENTQDLKKTKVIVAKFLRDRVKLAEDFDRVLVLAFPDLIFGRGLDRLIQSMKRGDYVLCPQARVDLESSLETFKRLIVVNRYSNRDLVGISLNQFPHNIVKLSIHESHAYLRIQKEKDSFLVNFKEPPPIAYWGDSSDLFNRSFERPTFSEFEVIDHDAPNLFFLASKLRLVVDSDFFFWAEMTSQKEYKKMIKNSFWLESAVYLNQCEVKWQC